VGENGGGGDRRVENTLRKGRMGVEKFRRVKRGVRGGWGEESKAGGG